MFCPGCGGEMMLSKRAGYDVWLCIDCGAKSLKT